MTRAVLLALGALAALVSWAVWASSRDLREPWVVPPMPDPDDDVQWDPWTRALTEPGTRKALDEGLADMAAGRMRPLRMPAADWLSSTQSGPIGPSA